MVRGLIKIFFRYSHYLICISEAKFRLTFEYLKLCNANCILPRARCNMFSKVFIQTRTLYRGSYDLFSNKIFMKFHARPSRWGQVDYISSIIILSAVFVVCATDLLLLPTRCNQTEITCRPAHRNGKETDFYRIGTKTNFVRTAVSAQVGTLRLYNWAHSVSVANGRTILTVIFLCW